MTKLCFILPDCGAAAISFNHETEPSLSLCMSHDIWLVMAFSYPHDCYVKASEFTVYLTECLMLQLTHGKATCPPSSGNIVRILEPASTVGEITPAFFTEVWYWPSESVASGRKCYSQMETPLFIKPVPDYWALSKEPHKMNAETWDLLECLSISSWGLHT